MINNAHLALIVILYKMLNNELYTAQLKRKKTQTSIWR